MLYFANRTKYAIADRRRLASQSRRDRTASVKGSSNVFTDRKELGVFAALTYGSSMMHCLPVGSNSPDALGLGAMWGRERAVKMLEEAGFSDINVVPTPHFLINILYVCRK
ncbi:unnamed protein product [Nippostrongylus brasiliensis]|uniref:Aminotran_5 domain-containing protein n=1 Tax=Nippostrongylus brasiliensis TaxID=27835 RepID=A0A0N4YZL7_NIPBR|nr:unnamed protein product [Nippostrongylus brasiliensis]